MVQHTKDHGKVIINGAMVFKHGQMAPNLLANGKETFNVVMDYTLIQVVIHIKVNGRMVNLMEKVNLPL
jgi:hypothetical protein